MALSSLVTIKRIIYILITIPGSCSALSRSSELKGWIQQLFWSPITVYFFPLHLLPFPCPPNFSFRLALTFCLCFWKFCTCVFFLRFFKICSADRSSPPFPRLNFSLFCLLLTWLSMPFVCPVESKWNDQFARNKYFWCMNIGMWQTRITFHITSSFYIYCIDYPASTLIR